MHRREHFPHQVDDNHRYYDNAFTWVNMPLCTCEICYRTATRRKGWSIVHFIRLDLKFCFLSHVLKELTVVVVVVVVLKIV